MFGYGVGSCVGRFHCFEHFRSLFLRWPEQYLGCQLHTRWNDARPESFTLIKGAFLPRLKFVGFLRSLTLAVYRELNSLDVGTILHLGSPASSLTGGETPQVALSRRTARQRQPFFFIDR